MFGPTLLRRSVLAVTLLALLSSCAQSPTGRRQLMLFDDKQLSALGSQSFDDLKKNTPINQNAQVNRYVQCVANAIIKATDAKYQQQAWEIVVFDSDQVNAFALPGGKIGVYTGLLLVAENQHQLAAVLGHEVAHVMAGHANERLSSNQALQTTLQVTDSALGVMNNRYRQEISGMLGLGAQVGLILPFSRMHETEADVVGLDLMARAGFDPDQSTKLWQNMVAQGSGQTPQFFSSHPAPENRIKALSEKIPHVLPLYQAAQQQGRVPRCNKS